METFSQVVLSRIVVLFKKTVWNKNQRYAKVYICVNVTRRTHYTRVWALVSWVVEGPNRDKMVVSTKKCFVTEN